MPTEKEYMLKQADAATTYQRKLTAGTGITIDQATNTISATGTGGSTVTWSGNYLQGNSLGVLSIDGASNPIKMPNLVQGQHITISQDATTGAYTISATAGDIMQGATSSTAGTAGLVPQPLAGDETKVLSGAGTWVAQSGGGVQTFFSTSAPANQGNNGDLYYQYMDYQQGSGNELTHTYVITNKYAKMNNEWILANDIIVCTYAEYISLYPTRNIDGRVYLVYNSGTPQLDPNYTYVEYQNGNDAITVRIYHQGESDEHIVWFFKGVTPSQAAPWEIPDELLPYKVDTQRNCNSMGYDSADSSNQIGWVGWSRSRSPSTITFWAMDYNFSTDTFYSVVDLSQGDEQTNPYSEPYIYLPPSDAWAKIYCNGIEYGGGSGGSTVIPNPSGTPTVQLNSIDINGTIYSIPSGGSGSGNTISYGTTAPSTPANDGDTYFMLNANNQRQATYLYITNAWVQIEGTGGGGTTPTEEAYSRIVYNTSSDVGVEGEINNE